MKDHITKIYNYFTPGDMNYFTEMVSSLKERADKIFSVMFLESFQDDNFNGLLMKQWAVFSKKIDKWMDDLLSSEGYNNFGGFYFTIKKEKIEKSLTELFDCFKETFVTLSKFSFFK